MRLTDNFTLEELCKSGVASRKDIDNTPNEEQIENLKRLAWLLERVRLAVRKPILINSGFRSKEVNKAVGGAKNSQHMLGCAADIRVAGLTPSQLMDCIADAGLKYDQLILEFDSWVHISVPSAKGDKPRGQELAVNKQGTSVFIPKLPPKIKPETPKPIAKTRTVKSSVPAMGVGAAATAAGVAQSIAPAVPVVGEVAQIAQENSNGLLIAVGLALVAFAIYMVYLKIDDHRKHS